MEHEVGITHFRDMPGVAAVHVACSDEPLIVRRYRRADVVLVPLWEWRFLKQIEHFPSVIGPVGAGESGSAGPTWPAMPAAGGLPQVPRSPGNA